MIPHATPATPIPRWTPITDGSTHGGTPPLVSSSRISRRLRSMAEILRPSSSPFLWPVSTANLIAGRTCSAALVSRASYSAWLGNRVRGRASLSVRSPKLMTGFVSNHPRRVGIAHIELTNAGSRRIVVSMTPLCLRFDTNSPAADGRSHRGSVLRMSVGTLCRWTCSRLSTWVGSSIPTGTARPHPHNAGVVDLHEHWPHVRQEAVGERSWPRTSSRYALTGECVGGWL